MRAGAEAGGEAGAQFGAVGEAGEGVVACAVGELHLVALALGDVLDVGEEEAGPVGGVGDDGVAQAHPEVGALAGGEADLGAPALGAGAQQGADVLGVGEVGEGVAAQGARAAAEEAAEGVVGAEDAAVLVPAHLGDGHAAGGELERLAEAFLTGTQCLLFAFQADQGPLHVGAEPGVGYRYRGLEGVHLEGFLAPGAGEAAVARAVDGDDAEEFVAAGDVERGEEAVAGVPLVLVAGDGGGGVPAGDAVLVELPRLGVRDEPQVTPVFGEGEAVVPGVPGADLAGEEGFGGGVPGDGGDDEVAVGLDEVDGGQFVAEAGDHAVGDGLEGVRETAGTVQVRDDLMQLPQGRKADVGLRLGLHALSPRDLDSNSRMGSVPQCHVIRSRPLNHSELFTRYTGSTKCAFCDSSHMIHG